MNTEVTVCMRMHLHGTDAVVMGWWSVLEIWTAAMENKAVLTAGISDEMPVGCVVGLI